MLSNELEELMQDSVQHIEKDFYNKKFYFSYSSLNKLLWNPAVFYQLYILGMKEEKLDSYLVQGKVIHALLLEEERFNEQFLVSPANLPTGNPRIVIDRVYSQFMSHKDSYDSLGVEELTQLQDEILDAMKAMNYHQSLKTDQQRLDKMITEESKNYWTFLKAKGRRVLIDQETYSFCMNAVELVKSNPSVCKLLGQDLTDFDNKEVINEYPFQLDMDKRNFGIKGIIDNIVIDHDQKIVFVNDVKTTSKDLKDFADSVEYYAYWLQAAIYLCAAGMMYKDLLENQGYILRFHFVVIDQAFQTYAFPIKDETMSKWIDRLEETIDIAEWHYTNRSFELPYQFAKGLAAL